MLNIPHTWSLLDTTNNRIGLQNIFHKERIWAPFHAKAPIESAHLWYVESMSKVSKKVKCPSFDAYSLYN